MADSTWEDPPTYSDDESDNDNETELPNTDEDSRRQEKNYVVLTEDDIKRLQNDDIEKVSSVLTIPPSEASLLLHHYRWQIEELQYEWFADSHSVRQKVGLLGSTTTSRQTTTCGICFETIDDFCEKREFLYTAAGCDHPYCKDCWRAYISIAINESGLGCLGLRCPDPECRAAVRRELVEEVAAREEVEKYSRFFVRSYVEGRREKVKWCVAPGCENAVEFELDGGSSFDVVCGCAHEFCWSCGQDAHRPVVCDTVRKWVLKNSSEAENTNWILAYTKACPKCKRPIEKNHGCNHMVCSPPCRHQFCWLCLGDFCGHGVCNRYKETGKRGDWKNEEERQRQMAKESLERYAHYYERWASNHKSRQKAIQDLHEMEKEKLKLLSKKENKPETELGFIVEAWQQIVECRRVLKWTYAYGYYLPESGESKVQLFECLQGEAEAALERLHRCAETELTKDFLGDNKDNKDDDEPKQDLYSFKQKLVGLTRITCKFFEDLVKALENGLSEAGCSREATRKGKGQKRKTSTSSGVAHHQPINNNNVAFLRISNDDDDDDDDEDDFGTWSCDVCTYINPEGATACVMCHERE